MESRLRINLSLINQFFVGKEDDLKGCKYRAVALLIAALLQRRQMSSKAFTFPIRNLNVDVGLHLKVDGPRETRDLQGTVDLRQMRTVSEAKVAVAHTPNC